MVGWNLRFFFLLVFVCFIAHPVWAKNEFPDKSEAQKIKNDYSNITKPIDGYYWALLSKQEKHNYLRGLFDGLTLLTEKIYNSRRCEFNTKKEVALEAYHLKYVKYSIDQISSMLDEKYQDKKKWTITINEIIDHIANGNR